MFFGIIYFSSCILMTISSILVILPANIIRKLAIYSLYLVHVYILNLQSTFFSSNIHEFLQNIDKLVLIIKYMTSVIIANPVLLLVICTVNTQSVM